MAYISKRTGEEVDALLDKIENGDIDIPIDTELSKTSNNAIANSTVTRAIGEKADKDGYYPKMTVGKAENLVGRGEATEEEFTFRASAGDLSIEDGSAKITKIKGNSVVWNQLVKNADFRNGTAEWSANNTTITINDDGSFRLLNNTGNSQGIIQDMMLAPNRRVLIEIDFMRSSATSSKATIYLRRKNIGGYDIHRSEDISNTNRNVYRAIINTTDSINALFVYPFITGETGSYCDVYSVRVFDITNREDITSVADADKFFDTLPLNVDAFAYNSGEVINMNVGSIKSVGDNAWNPETERAKIIGGKNYHISGNYNGVYFYPDTNSTNSIDISRDEVEDDIFIFPENGTIELVDAQGDICVCLKHSYDKQSAYYQDEVIDLSFLTKEFPNGMQSAGNAYDEIRLNQTTKKWEKVTRISVVNLGSLAWTNGGTIQGSTTKKRWYAALDAKSPLANAERANIFSIDYPTISADECYLGNEGLAISKSLTGVFLFTDALSLLNPSDIAVALQGVMLYYELGEPIVEEIDLSPNFNLDYLIWDFGTEEAIASVPSAPFRADIIYQFNAVDRIRNNSDKIAELEAKIASLTQAMSAIQTSNMEE